MTPQETVLITGSQGRIGSLLTERLAGRYRILGFDRGEAKRPGEAAEYFDVDLAEEESLRGALRQVREQYGTRLATVVHLAGYYSFTEQDHPLHEEVNVGGTERLLRALRDLEVERFLFSSTMLVHRPCEPGEWISEDSPLDRETDWGYPGSKIRAEDLLLREHGETPLAILRIAAVYDSMCRLIPLSRQIQRIYERRLTSHLFPGDPGRGMTYLHMEDLLDAMERGIDRRANLPPEAILLLGEAEPVAYSELQKEIGCLLHGKEWGTHPIPETVARAGAWLQDKLPTGEDPFIKPWMISRSDDHYALDTRRARSLLDWQPRHSLREVLPQMLAALKEDPARWYEENGLESSPDERP